MFDQWIQYNAEDWAFLIALCSIAVWMRRSRMIRDFVANWFPVMAALIYGAGQAWEAGYGIGTHLMAKGVIMAAGTIAAQSIADRVLPVKPEAKVPPP